LIDSDEEVSQIEKDFEKQIIKFVEEKNSLENQKRTLVKEKETLTKSLNELMKECTELELDKKNYEKKVEDISNDINKICENHNIEGHVKGSKKYNQQEFKIFFIFLI
jgi:peptidoglycan hydrolase CwlO-like protein